MLKSLTDALIRFRKFPGGDTELGLVMEAGSTVIPEGYVLVAVPAEFAEIVEPLFSEKAKEAREDAHKLRVADSNAFVAFTKMRALQKECFAQMGAFFISDSNDLESMKGFREAYDRFSAASKEHKEAESIAAGIREANTAKGPSWFDLQKEFRKQLDDVLELVK